MYNRLTSAVLGPVEKHLKYPQATLAAGLAVVAATGLGLASTQLPEHAGGSEHSAAGGGVGRGGATWRGEPRICSGLTVADQWACDPSFGDAYVSISAFSTYADQQSKFADNDPATWQWVTNAIRPKVEKDPFIEEFKVNVEVDYSDPNGSAKAQADALHIASLASSYLDIPEGSVVPGEGVANARQTDQDAVVVTARRPAICVD